MADNEKQTDLKKRARRRLVGAAALALLAAIILPMVMDHEPRQSGPDIQIRIPSQEGANFAARTIQGRDPAPARPKLPAAQSAPGAAPEQDSSAPIDVADADPEARPSARPEVAVAKPEVATPRPEPTPERKPEPTKPPTKPEPKPEQRDDGARAAALLGEQVASESSSYVVQLGVFKDAANARAVRAEAKAAGYSSFVETVGDKTRVRAGPFDSREAAEQAAQKLRRSGLTAVVQPRS